MHLNLKSAPQGKGQSSGKHHKCLYKSHTPSSNLRLSYGPHWLPIIYFPGNQGQRTHFRGSFLIGCLPHTVE